jgi:hypothetical protein
MKDLTYEELTNRIKEENRLYEAKQKILRAKREERKRIQQAGGGHSIAKQIMGRDTDFNYGANVDAEDPNRCMGQVVCKKCGKFHGYCIEVEEEKEKSKMLPTGEKEDGRRPQRSGGLNFINTVDLTAQPQEAKILMVKYTDKGKQGPSITLKLAFKNEIRFLWVPCRKSDPRYAILLNSFGPNENNWIDERINLLLEKDDFSDNYKQSIQVPEKTPAKKGGKN